MRLRRGSIVVLVLLGVVAAACGSGQSAGSTHSQGSDPGTVRVLYAGSLVNLMEHQMGPKFDAATGGHFEGYAAGSSKIGQEITGKVRRGDVFLSASPSVNTDLGPTWVRWYATFATAPLLLGYNPKSSFAHDLKTESWTKAITEPGIRVGRTDPKLDPKGELTVQAFENVGTAFATKAEKSVQVLPEEDLVGRLQTGQLDAAFFYSSEATETHIPTVPIGGHLGATYTITVLRHAPNASGGAAFVHFLLGPAGTKLLHEHGLRTTGPTVSGNRSDVPASLRKMLAD